jgi:hypothetical protein
MASAVTPTALAGTVPSGAGPAEPWLGIPLLPRPTPMSEPLTSPIPVELTPAGASASGLTNRKVRSLAFRSLPVRSRQSGANQTTMNRTVVLDGFSSGAGGVGTIGFRRWIEWLSRSDIDIGGFVTQFCSFRGRFGAQRTVHRFSGSGFGAFSTRRGDLRPSEFVVRVASSAACLLDLILNRGHHRMTGDAALAGAVVVQDVTEPKPALLH